MILSVLKYLGMGVFGLNVFLNENFVCQLDSIYIQIIFPSCPTVVRSLWCHIFPLLHIRLHGRGILAAPAKSFLELCPYMTRNMYELVPQMRFVGSL